MKKKTKKDYDSLLNDCVSYSDFITTSEDINNLINYYRKNILMITYAKLMLKSSSLTSKGLEGSVVVFALPVGENKEGKVIFSMTEAVVQPDTAKKVNSEIQKIYRNSLKNISQEERFTTTEKLVISEIKSNQEEISKLSSVKSLNISDEKYTWDEYSIKFLDTYGYEPTEFNYSNWIEYKTTMIDTRNLNWNNVKQDIVIEQLHDGAREVQGMTMNQLLQPYDLLGIDNTDENSIDNYNNSNDIELQSNLNDTNNKNDPTNKLDTSQNNNYGFVDVEDDNFDIEEFMKPTIQDIDYKDYDEKTDLVENNYDKQEFKFFNNDLNLIDDNEGTNSEFNDIESELEENDVENSFVEPVSASDQIELNSDASNEENNSMDEIIPEDLFKRIKFIKYDDLIDSSKSSETDSNVLSDTILESGSYFTPIDNTAFMESSNIESKNNDIDNFFERLNNNFEKIKKM